MNTSIAPQLEIALQDLKLASPEAMGDAISNVILKSQEALNLAKGLSPQERAVVEAKALQASLSTGTILSGLRLDEQAEEKRKKEREETLRLIHENPLQNIDAIKQQEEKLTAEIRTATALTEALVSTGRLTSEQAEEFSALASVLEIKGIAEEFVPFEQKAAIIQEIFEKDQALEYLERDIRVNAVQQVLTGYADYAKEMPDLTKSALAKSALDSFRDVEKNKAHIEQCDALVEKLEAKREELAATGNQEELAVVEKLAKETKNTKTITTAAVCKEGITGVLSGLGIEAKKQVQAVEQKGNVETFDVGKQILKILREKEQQKLERFKDALEGKWTSQEVKREEANTKNEGISF